MKICSKCKIAKNFNWFSKSNYKADGFVAWCKICVKEADHKRYLNNRLKLIEKSRNIKLSVKNSEKPILENKICSVCCDNLDIKLFSRNKYAKDGYSYKCRNCLKLYRELRLAKVKYDVKSLKKCIICSLEKNIKCFSKDRYSKDMHVSVCKACIYNREISYKPVRIKYKRIYKKQKRRTDSSFRLREVISSAVNKYIKLSGGSKNNNSILSYLPYNINELRKHIESLWEPWMNWGNYGKYNSNKKTWQMDHIIPQSKLPFTSLADENFLKCWELDNLRPLETIANIKKGNRAE
jgi:hypothetical protein